MDGEEERRADMTSGSDFRNMCGRFLGFWGLDGAKLRLAVIHKHAMLGKQSVPEDSGGS